MKKLNWECFIQISVLVVLDILLFTALTTGKMKYYVHPRIEKYVWFAAAALLVIALSMLPRLFRPKHKINILPCIILAIPIMTGFAIPASTAGSANMQLGGGIAVASGTLGRNTGGGTQDTSQAAPDRTGTQDDLQTGTQNGLQTGGQTAGTDQLQDPAASDGNTPPASQDIIESDAAKAFNSDSDFITVSDDDFLAWYADAYDNPGKYEGKTIKIKGTVFRMKDFGKDEFVPARMSMVCCAADLAPYGFICKSSSASQWKDNDWVYVTAKIKVEYEKHMDMKAPVLYALDITKAEKPEDEYVYPY